ncbi:MAG: BamA/TamA family outer membrane protein [Bacteroidaceae bacterium]|nr:BamA/TamA family outer membrane protein [Bacteroidaceae bacterium]
MKKAVLTSVILCAAVQAFAQVERKDTALYNPVHNTEHITAVQAPTTTEYREKKEKPISFFFAGAPSYTKTTSLMLSICGSGEYRWDRDDYSIQRSNFTVYANASISGIATLGLYGKNFLKHDAVRINYDFFVQKTKARTWGIGYEDGSRLDENETNFKRVQIKFEPEVLFRVADNLYIGPTASLERNTAYSCDRINPEWIKEMEQLYPETKVLNMIDEQGNLQNLHFFDHHFSTLGFGYTINYDSRDFILNASKGFNVRFSQMFFPNFLVGGKMKYASQLPAVMQGIAEHSGFVMQDLTFDFYHHVWKGATLAFEFHGRYNAGKNVPWVMMAEVGGSSRMRGYFQGRYRDKGLLESQIELRQHIKGRSGAVLWIGAANIFPSFDKIRMRNTLGNYGIGYRFELKHGINIRADLGFTNEEPGLVFGINEAF